MIGFIKLTVGTYAVSPDLVQDKKEACTTVRPGNLEIRRNMLCTVQGRIQDFKLGGRT